jgi:hypothetical protein
MIKMKLWWGIFFGVIMGYIFGFWLGRNYWLLNHTSLFRDGFVLAFILVFSFLLVARKD